MSSRPITSFFPPSDRLEKARPVSQSSKHRIAKRPTTTKPAPKMDTKTSSSNIKTDVLISIHAVHLKNIVSRQKNHEYRKYRLRDGVERLWLYETALDGGKMSITHIAVIPDSVRHTPGSVPTEPFGIGNEDFNAGRKESKYGYPILELYELLKPVTLAEMKAKWGFGSAPMGWRYMGPELWMDRWGETEDARAEKLKKIF